MSTGTPLEESETHYRELIEAIDHGLCIIQVLFDESQRPVDYRFLETNSAFEEHTGLRSAVGRTARELVPTLEESWFALYGRVALTGERTTFENHAPAMNRWFEVEASRIGPPEQHQVVLVFKNITERKRAEADRERLIAERNAAHDRLLALLKDAPAFVCTLRGPDHVIELVNDPYERLVGRGRPLVGRPVREALPEVVGQGFVEMLDRVYQTGQPFIGRETPIQLDRHGSGTLDDIYVNFVYQPRRAADGSVEGIDAFGFEVTDQVRARQQAEELAAELRGRSEFEEQLIGIVSHDLRNPITAILLGASALLRADQLSEKETRGVVRIRTAAERAHRLIRDLLDFTEARLSHRMIIHRREADLAEVVGGVVLEIEAAHPGSRLDVELEGDLRGFWDPDRVAQVIQNLLANAVKYGAPEGRIRVRARGDADNVQVSVHNQGAPIPAEKQQAIFRPLQRGTDASGSLGRSIGLGLYIVLQLVQAHGGTIGLTSTAEEGTTFLVTLPRRQAPQ